MVNSRTVTKATRNNRQIAWMQSPRRRMGCSYNPSSWSQAKSWWVAQAQPTLRRKVRVVIVARRLSLPVMPAHAGIQAPWRLQGAHWISAFVEMTGESTSASLVSRRAGRRTSRRLSRVEGRIRSGHDARALKQAKCDGPGPAWQNNVRRQSRPPPVYRFGRLPGGAVRVPPSKARLAARAQPSRRGLISYSTSRITSAKCPSVTHHHSNCR